MPIRLTTTAVCRCTEPRTVRRDTFYAVTRSALSLCPLFARKFEIHQSSLQNGRLYGVHAALNAVRLCGHVLICGIRVVRGAHDLRDS